MTITITIKNVGNAPYQSRDPSPTMPTHERKQEEKVKTVEDKN